MSMATLKSPRPRGFWGRLQSSPLLLAALVVPLIVLAACAWVFVRSGLFGFHAIAHRGTATWSTVARNDDRLSLAMRMALEDPPPAASPGPLEWRPVSPGLEVADLAVMARGSEVDTLLLTRIDPARFTFRAMTAPAGDRDLDAWLAATRPAVIVNGSAHTARGMPGTPVLSDGRQYGPLSYQASHGAFVAGSSGASLRDLVQEPWQQAATGATQAIVSFPLLIGADGKTRTQRADRRWLANRSFIGQDSQGRVIVGTTKDAFFSLDRLAEFLMQAPLDLKLALNLNGGPLACQAVVAADKVVRNVCGSFETRVQGEDIKLLGRLFGSSRWPLPVVLTAFPR